MNPESLVIEFSLFGLDLLEPNVLLTDVLLGLFCLVFSVRIFRRAAIHPFFRSWAWFMSLFGLAAIFGGLGHAFANYWGVPGKIPAWILSTVSVYYIEYAMISALQNKKWYKLLSTISLIKMIVILLLIILIAILAPRDNKIDLCILVVIINSLAGVSLSAGVLGWSYYRMGFSRHFKRIMGGVLIIIPSSAVFLLDFNLFQWFDKNDLSHLILLLGITAFYQAVLRLHKEDPTVLQIALDRK